MFPKVSQRYFYFRKCHLYNWNVLAVTHYGCHLLNCKILLLWAIQYRAYEILQFKGIYALPRSWGGWCNLSGQRSSSCTRPADAWCPLSCRSCTRNPGSTWGKTSPSPAMPMPPWFGWSSRWPWALQYSEKKNVDEAIHEGDRESVGERGERAIGTATTQKESRSRFEVSHVVYLLCM